MVQFTFVKWTQTSGHQYQPVGYTVRQKGYRFGQLTKSNNQFLTLLEQPHCTNCIQSEIVRNLLRLSVTITVRGFSTWMWNKSITNCSVNQHQKVIQDLSRLSRSELIGKLKNWGEQILSNSKIDQDQLHLVVSSSVRRQLIIRNKRAKN